MWIHFTFIQSDGMELRDLRLRIVRHHTSTQSMASLPSGFKPPGDDLIGSQKFDLLPHGSEVKSPTSKMESTPLIIRHETSTHTRIPNGAIRCIVTES
jgi:hypothetical protein